MSCMAGKRSTRTDKHVQIKMQDEKDKKDKKNKEGKKDMDGRKNKKYKIERDEGELEPCQINLPSR